MKKTLRFWALSVAIVIVAFFGMLSMILLKVIASVFLFPNKGDIAIKKINRAVNQFIDACEKIDRPGNEVRK